jgi:prophage DNA circulation protein
MLWPATFRGAEFHVEVREFGSGRRIVTHEFAHRDIPYTEDLGRRARRFQVTGYLIGLDFIEQRRTLQAALEVEGPGPLLLPTMSVQRVLVDTYRITERRERGGYCDVDMTFVEAGDEISTNISTDTQSQTAQAADNASSTAETGATDVLNSQWPQQTPPVWPDAPQVFASSFEDRWSGIYQ